MGNGFVIGKIVKRRKNPLPLLLIIGLKPVWKKTEKYLQIYDSE
jgi:hypothetical protein